MKFFAPVCAFEESYKKKTNTFFMLLQKDHSRLFKMTEKQGKVYEFKITILRSSPPIWRRIQVPEDFTFRQFAFAIRIAVGWRGSHLHEFTMRSPINGSRIIVSSGAAFDDIIDEKRTKLKDMFTLENCKATFVYDLGDCWDHEVKLKKIIPAVLHRKYPILVSGKRACPPEYCGGIGRYEELREILKTPKEERFEDDVRDLRRLGLKDDFNPERFNRNVSFHKIAML